MMWPSSVYVRIDHSLTGKKESRPSSSIEVLAHVTSSSSEDELPSATRRKRSRTEGELRTDDRV